MASAFPEHGLDRPTTRRLPFPQQASASGRGPRARPQARRRGSGWRGTACALLGLSVLTLVQAAEASPGSFVVQNRQVGAFAAMAATPGVKVLTGDFNGDGRTDIALVNLRPGWNTVPVALSTATGFTIQNRPAGAFAGWATTPGVQVLTGDFVQGGLHCDGTAGTSCTDIALVNQSPGWGAVPIAVSSPWSFTIQNPPAGMFASWATTPGVQVLTGDFDGDGCTDIALVRQTAGWTSIPVALSRP